MAAAEIADELRSLEQIARDTGYGTLAHLLLMARIEAEYQAGED